MGIELVVPPGAADQGLVGVGVAGLGPVVVGRAGGTACTSRRRRMWPRWAWFPGDIRAARIIRQHVSLSQGRFELIVEQAVDRLGLDVVRVVQLDALVTELLLRVLVQAEDADPLALLADGDELGLAAVEHLGIAGRVD